MYIDNILLNSYIQTIYIIKFVYRNNIYDDWIDGYIYLRDVYVIIQYIIIPNMKTTSKITSSSSSSSASKSSLVIKIDKYEKLKDTLQRWIDKATDLKERNAILTEENTALEEENNELHNNLKEQSDESDLQSVNRELERKIRELNKENKSLQKSITKLEREHDREIRLLKDEFERQDIKKTNKIEMLEEKLELSKEMNKELKEDLKEIRAKHN